MHVQVVATLCGFGNPLVILTLPGFASRRPPQVSQAADLHDRSPTNPVGRGGVAELAKAGNKKTFVSVKDGTSSTMMTCMLKESNGKSFEQANVVTKVLQCPATTTAKSQTNSGEWADIKCKCDDKTGCPKK